MLMGPNRRANQPECADLFVLPKTLIFGLEGSDKMAHVGRRAQVNKRPARGHWATHEDRGPDKRIPGNFPELKAMYGILEQSVEDCGLGEGER